MSFSTTAPAGDSPFLLQFDGIPDALVGADTAPGPTVQINYTEALLIGMCHSSWGVEYHLTGYYPQTTVGSTSTTLVRNPLFFSSHLILSLTSSTTQCRAQLPLWLRVVLHQLRLREHDHQECHTRSPPCAQPHRPRLRPQPWRPLEPLRHRLHGHFRRPERRRGRWKRGVSGELPSSLKIL